MKHEVTVCWVDRHCSYHIPDIRVVTCEPLQVDKQSELIIKLCNPTQHQTTVQFLPLPCAEDDLEEREKEIEKKINTEEGAAQVNCQSGGLFILAGYYAVGIFIWCLMSQIHHL